MSEAEQKLYDRYIDELKLNSEVANTLARDARLSDFYSESLNLTESSPNPVGLANIVTNEIARELKEKSLDELKFNPIQIAELVKMVDDETISSKIAKQVFEDMVKSGENPTQIVEAKGLVQISDPSEISPIIDEIIAKKPLPFTAKNVAMLAKEFYGEPYGWGGSYECRDCSATTRDFLGAFGIFLRRNSGKQVEDGENINIKGLTKSTKKKKIIKGK